MFVWRCDTFMNELKSLLPASYNSLTRVAQALDTPEGPATLNAVYPTLQKISVDYAIMEPASTGRGAGQVVTVEMHVQWLDVGSWPALAETLYNDDHDNAVECKSCLFVDSDNNIIVSNDPEHLVTTVGVSDMIIVHTRDITMVCPKTESQRVKDLVGKVKEKFGAKYL